jgi:hypothetical protein
MGPSLGKLGASTTGPRFFRGLGGSAFCGVVLCAGCARSTVERWLMLDRRARRRWRAGGVDRPASTLRRGIAGRRVRGRGARCATPLSQPIESASSCWRSSPPRRSSRRDNTPKSAPESSVLIERSRATRVMTTSPARSSQSKALRPRWHEGVWVRWPLARVRERLVLPKPQGPCSTLVRRGHGRVRGTGPRGPREHAGPDRYTHAISEDLRADVAVFGTK